MILTPPSVGILLCLSSALSGGTNASMFSDGIQLVFAVLVLGLGVSVCISGIRPLFADKTVSAAA